MIIIVPLILIFLYLLVGVMISRRVMKKIDFNDPVLDGTYGIAIVLLWPVWVFFGGIWFLVKPSKK